MTRTDENIPQSAWKFPPLSVQTLLLFSSTDGPVPSEWFLPTTAASSELPPPPRKSRKSEARTADSRLAEEAEQLEQLLNPKSQTFFPDGDFAPDLYRPVRAGSDLQTVEEQLRNLNVSVGKSLSYDQVAQTFEHRVRCMSVIRATSPTPLTSFSANYQKIWGHAHLFHGNDLGLLTVLQLMGLTTTKAMKGSSPHGSDPVLNPLIPEDRAVVSQMSDSIYIEKASCRLEEDFADLVAILHRQIEKTTSDTDRLNQLTLTWEQSFGKYFSMFSLLQYLGYPTLVSYVDDVFSRRQMNAAPDKTEVELEEIMLRLRRAVSRVGTASASSLAPEAPPFVPLAAQHITRDSLIKQLQQLVASILNLRGSESEAQIIVIPDLYEAWSYVYQDMPSLSSVLIRMGISTLPGFLKEIGFRVGPDLLNSYPLYIGAPDIPFPLSLEVGARTAVRTEIRDALRDACEQQRGRAAGLQRAERLSSLPTIAQQLVPGSVPSVTESADPELLEGGIFGVLPHWLPVYYESVVAGRLHECMDRVFPQKSHFVDTMRLFDATNLEDFCRRLSGVQQIGPSLIPETILLKYFPHLSAST
ncbi:MAG: uncharacterized protein KVP18_005024 [Porospora cf. gigantea A]|uniref:uncharacterized protein n=1 Tax=Porospora cf. gigantea A TaxID=2853593 RepID=UPI00355A707F|nr:MAG: hypothetical protein KVP18_005024 [Porospora cf. gigantea A]